MHAGRHGALCQVSHNADCALSLPVRAERRTCRACREPHAACAVIGVRGKQKFERLGFAAVIVQMPGGIPVATVAIGWCAQCGFAGRFHLGASDKHCKQT